MLVAIDPGHGGKDTGAIGGRLVEAAWVWDAAGRLRAELAKAGIDSVLTRERDANPFFFSRGLATRLCDAVVSIHVNAHILDHVAGLECYHWPGSIDGAALAAQIASRCPRPLLPAHREAGRIISADDDAATTSDDWLQRPRIVLRRHRPPAVLVECGYASNPEDREYLLSEYGLMAVVLAIAGGVGAWVGARAAA